jgi:hypothetical protein
MAAAPAGSGEGATAHYNCHIAGYPGSGAQAFTDDQIDSTFAEHQLHVR